MPPLDFPNSPTVGQIWNSWQWDGVKWSSAPVASGGSGGGDGGGGIPEAPLTGIAYGRQNSNWTQVLMVTGDVLDGGNF